MNESSDEFDDGDEYQSRHGPHVLSLLAPSKVVKEFTAGHANEDHGGHDRYRPKGPGLSLDRRQQRDRRDNFNEANDPKGGLRKSEAISRLGHHLVVPDALKAEGRKDNEEGDG